MQLSEAIRNVLRSRDEGGARAERLHRLADEIADSSLDVEIYWPTTLRELADKLEAAVRREQPLRRGVLEERAERIAEAVQIMRAPSSEQILTLGELLQQ